MADKKNSTTSKPKTSSATKPTAAKPATVKAAPSAKPAAAAAKPAATKPAAVKPAAKPATVKAAPSAKPAAAAAKPAATKPAETKPAATNSQPKTSKPAVAAASAKSADKPKTTAKTKPAKTAESGGIGSKFAALTKNKKLFYIVVSAVAFVFVLALVLGIALGVRSCKKSGVDNDSLAGGFTISKPENNNYVAGSVIKPGSAYSPVSAGVETMLPDSEIKNYAYNAKYQTNTIVGYSAKIIGTVERKIPETVRDEGLGVYPKYGYTLSTVIGAGSDAVKARNALIRESSYLTATGTSNAGGGGYTWMDENGFLYSGTRAEPVETLDKSGKQRRLYKHTASIGLYLGNVADNEPGIIKEVTMRNRSYNGYGVTGVYAPAGELIKIQLSGKDMDTTGGITVHIGQALYNGKANNIWTTKNQMQRIPHLLNTMQVNKNTAVYDEETDMWTAYVGSFIGGPVYIRNITSTFTARISGGVAYRHFILGYTTEDEFEESSKSSAPYFDLEVWDRGVLHSGPLNYAKTFNYEQLYNAAVLWDKVASVSTTNGTYQGIVFLYDPFVAAGAAVAFPGQRSVNCPAGWMSASLNYDAIVTSGSWGNFHEYHHNFQNYGVGDTGEVTNNALTLVSYSLFTKISAARQIASYGGAGLSGWNQYTSATWALQRVNNAEIKSTNGLAVYSTLLHNLGQDAFIKSRGATGAAYFNKWAANTHQDFTYYASQIGTYTGTVVKPAATNYPTFVPVASVYQTGRSYLYRDYDENNTEIASEKRDIETMQPYVIPYDAPFTVDLRPYLTSEGGQYVQGSVVIGKGFKYSIKSFNANGLNGNATFVETGEKGVYTFTPDKAHALSGKIRVTLGITTESGSSVYNGKALDDVDLILEFQQSRETNKTILERTTYTYAAGNMYSDAQTAFESGFSGYESVKGKWDHSNPTQNCNTDIWLYPDTPENRNKYPNAPESYFVHDNTIEVIDGKLYVPEDGKYRVYLRGRLNCALYYSLDGASYKLGATIKDKTVPANSAKFRPDDENTYFDVEFSENEVYVDGTLVKFDHSGTRWIYIKEVLVVQSSPAVSYIGVGLTQWTVPMYTTTTDEDGTTHYFDSTGKEVSAEEANNTDPIAPANGTYVNAYRTTYEFSDNSGFKTDYFYVRQYNYNYNDNVHQNKEQTLVSTNYNAGVSWNINNFKPEYLTDGNRNTFIHTKNGVGASAEKPLEMTIDMGEVKSVNRMVIYTQNRPNGDWHCPKNFTLYGSLDGNEFFTVGEFTDAPRVGTSVTVNFEETSFRYYKLVVTGSYSSLMIIGEIEMWNVFEVNNGTAVSPDDGMFTYSGDWKGLQTHSTFGHVYRGGSGDKITFNFEGSRLAILNPSSFGRNYEVWIDGKKVDSIKVKEVTGNYGLYYLSGELAAGTHSVEIRCTGEACFDSFVIYP